MTLFTRLRLSLVGFLIVGATGWGAGAPVVSQPRLAPPAFKTAPGYEVTLIHTVERETHGSWVSIAADPRGRLYVSDQYGPVRRITLPAKDGGPVHVEAVPFPLGGAHGLAWIDGGLYAVVGQKNICATGLHRARDTDGDGELDRVELLREIAGEGEHGPHAVVAAPDGRSLYVIAGNATKLPVLTRSRVPRLWAEDSLLRPLPALMGSETRGILPGGWICRTDLDGLEWELHAAGLRNAYAVACDANGEVFTCDSDTEFEINLPWYRPTRVVHATSGADFGWRRGALKIPDAAPDAWPVLQPMGMGSPTAVLFAPHAKVAAAQRDALWVADWSYGKIFALALRAAGATFTATRTEIVSATPLPITAMAVNPADGAIYFTTGGRRMHSALYRLRWTGAADETGRTVASTPMPEVELRRRLEGFHGRSEAAAVDAAWSGLGHADTSVRHAARTAIESQPSETWRRRALSETNPRAALTGLLALIRADAPANRTEILAALRRLHESGMAETLRGDWLRTLSLAFSRGGATTEGERTEWAAIIEALPSSTNAAHGSAILELLVYCGAPTAAERGMRSLRSAATREAQIDLAKSLVVLTTGWTPETRRELFAWLAGTASWRGGGSFALDLRRLRDEALASAPEGERPAFRELLEGAAKRTATTGSRVTERRTVRAWTTDDIAMLADRDTRRRDPERGRRLFSEAGCFACHAHGGEGGALGPDLSDVGRRLALRDLAEAIFEPSREISDQYGAALVTLRDGRRLTGRIVNQVEDGYHLAENLLEPAVVTRLTAREVASIEPSPVSLMPPGLLDAFDAEEILDLIAFLRRPRAVADSP